ncbi:hypothetical protein [Infirmifilum sp. SLHALR2]|nr:MAG: hypothetical protein B7L53_09665 [Thermofilum sp. NZ13]
MDLGDSLLVLSSFVVLAMLAGYGYSLYRGSIASAADEYVWRVAALVNATALSLRPGEEAVIELPMPVVVKGGVVCHALSCKPINATSSGVITGVTCLRLYRRGGVRVTACEGS